MEARETRRSAVVVIHVGEGWIIGKPAILLHTRDAGTSWERIPLSPKLPGDPYGIVALGPGKAEMSTSAGAIYTTENAGRNWKAEVRETIDATLNRVSSSGVQVCAPGASAGSAAPPPPRRHHKPTRYAHAAAHCAPPCARAARWLAPAHARFALTLGMRRAPV